MKAVCGFKVSVKLHTASFDVTINTNYMVRRVVTVHVAKVPARVTDHSSQTTADFKNEWSWTSNLYSLMACAEKKKHFADTLYSHSCNCNSWKIQNMKDNGPPMFKNPHLICTILLSQVAQNFRKECRTRFKINILYCQIYNFYILVNISRWHYGRKVSRGCLRIWCWGEYLYVRGTR